ncbi:MAG: hypothetical protein QXX36_02505 [Candidatus Rehaiarchaeum fermentans]|nr:hypothetical protein [Candidatus Rehaiarchaeum fermentans]MCW1297414.1 hypothetical protein [Candidatus Rehaiarchaeum fermentans]MCW1302471.1 hypothetical protein [Candidatus Rehaiarchaeum fermentans]
MVTLRKGSILFSLLIIIFLVLVYYFTKISIIIQVASFFVLFLVVELLSPYELYIPLLIGAILSGVGIFVSFYSEALQEFGAMLSPLGAIISLASIFLKFGHPVVFNNNFTVGIWVLIVIMSMARLILGRRSTFYFPSYFFSNLLSAESVFNFIIVVAIYLLFLLFTNASLSVILAQILNNPFSTLSSIKL